MYYNHMVLSNNTFVHPSYLSKEEKLGLKNYLAREGIKMYCGCSNLSDEDEKLEYTISSDARFVPLHQHYKHDPLCTRFISENNKRNTPYKVEENGTAKAYLNFDVKSFTIPKLKAEKEDNSPNKDNRTDNGTDGDTNIPIQDVEDNKTTKEVKISNQEPQKEISNSLEKFILTLNTDAYRERTSTGKGLLSADYFLSVVNSRLKKVYIDGIEKPIRDITLEDDAFSFFYNPLIEIKGYDSYNLVLQGYNKSYSIFIFDGILQRELNRFEKRYNIPLAEAIQKYKVMAAGFIYLRFTKRQTLYKVAGRVHFFIVNNNGLYCRNLEEIEELDAISDFLKENQRYKTIQFHRQIEDNVFGMLTSAGQKQIILCKPRVPKNIKPIGKTHIAVGTEMLTLDFLRSTVEEWYK